MNTPVHFIRQAGPLMQNPDKPTPNRPNISMAKVHKITSYFYDKRKNFVPWDIPGVHGARISAGCRWNIFKISNSGHMGSTQLPCHSGMPWTSRKTKPCFQLGVNGTIQKFDSVINHIHPCIMSDYDRTKKITADSFYQNKFWQKRSVVLSWILEPDIIILSKKWLK